MVGIGGFVQRQTGLTDAFLSPGQDFQRLTSFGGKMYWWDDEKFLTFQPLLSNQPLTVGLSKAFAVVPDAHDQKWRCTKITVAFDTRYTVANSGCQMAFYEKRIDGTYVVMNSGVYFGATGITDDYFTDLYHDLNEGSTIYIEVVAVYGVQPNGFTATATIVPRVGANSPVDQPFILSPNNYPDVVSAIQAGVTDAFAAFDGVSLQGTEGAVFYTGNSANKYVKGFFTSPTAAALVVPYGSLYCLKDSLLGADNKLMIYGTPPISVASIVKGYYVDNAAALAGGLVAGQLYALIPPTIIDAAFSVYKVL